MKSYKQSQLKHQAGSVEDKTRNHQLFAHNGLLMYVVVVPGFLCLRQNKIGFMHQDHTSCSHYQVNGQLQNRH